MCMAAQTHAEMNDYSTNLNQEAGAAMEESVSRCSHLDGDILYLSIVCRIGGGMGFFGPVNSWSQVNSSQ